MFLQCKDGKIGNNTLYVLYFAMLIIEDAIVGIMILIALLVAPCAVSQELQRPAKRDTKANI
jgi:hypothetical protein